jgi:hypothetical protein
LQPSGAPLKMRVLVGPFSTNRDKYSPISPEEAERTLLLIGFRVITAAVRAPNP